MAAPKAVTAQRDFSAGEVDSDLKRDDERPEFKTGLRQCSNWRILNSKKLSNRFGRRALVKASDRVEEVLMAPGVTYYLAFPAGFLKVFDSTWTQVFSEARTWDATTAKDVVWCLVDKSIYITFNKLVPRVLTWDGVTTWTTADYAETVTAGNQKRTLFYRISPKNITMQPSAQTGSGITLTFSAGMNLVAGHVGTRMRFIGRQLLITAVASAISATATVEESLAGSQVLTFLIDPSATFNISDLVAGTVTNSQGVVTAISAGAKTITVQLTQVSSGSTGPSSSGPPSATAFTTTDVVIGPGGGLPPSAVSAIGVPQPVVIWDDEVMNTLRGWPSSCFADQNRLGFCNFSSLPSGLAWSALSLPNDFYVGANPADAIFELAPNRSQVFYGIPGMDGSLFVFCDNRLYYIPINVTNPLKPGSVQFSTVSEDECGQVQPRRAGEFILYATGGLNQLMAVRIYGAYTRAYRTEGVTELAAHLFTSIRAIAIMTASASFAERYIFVLNTDGSVVVGRYNTDKNNDVGTIGWTPWTGNGTVKWVSCKGSNILFTTSYAPNGIAAVQIVEQIDDSRYLDGSQLYNTQPSGLPIPGGKGPAWWLAGGSADLMDQGTRMMGTYQIDANGFIVPQNNGGEDLTAATLVFGQAWTAIAEPFVGAAQPGQDVQQRMNKRAISQITAYVMNSTGFLMAGQLKSGTTIPGGPALGTVMQDWRIPTWNQDDNPTLAPPLREESYERRPTGRDHDPRCAIIKDTPGPIKLLEIAIEVSL